MNLLQQKPLLKLKIKNALPGCGAGAGMLFTLYSVFSCFVLLPPRTLGTSSHPVSSSSIRMASLSWSSFSAQRNVTAWGVRSRKSSRRWKCRRTAAPRSPPGRRSSSRRRYREGQGCPSWRAGKRKEKGKLLIRVHSGVTWLFLLTEHNTGKGICSPAFCKRLLGCYEECYQCVALLCFEPLVATGMSHRYTLYMFCRQKTGYLPGSQQKKSKGNLYVRCFYKALVSTKTCGVVESLFMSDFSLCFVYAVAWWEKVAGEC